MYRFSERLAVVAGIVLPVGETLRRWGSLWVQPWAYLDDIFIGAFFARRLTIGSTRAARRAAH